jgi:prepilin-type N-terminal cleavage/methylation domain-containing protein
VKKNRGFTLIEILIAVFILGIVLSTVFASYTGTFRIIREAGADAELYGMARTVFDRMIRDLDAVVPWKGAFVFQAKPYSLGRREFMRLTFRSAAHVAFDEQEAPEGIAVIEYGLEETKEADGTEKEGYTLYRSDSLRRDPEKEGNAAGKFPLCDRVETLTYRFFDAAGKEYATWDAGAPEETQQKRAPAMMEIRLGLTNEKDRERPIPFMTRIRLPFNQVTTR